MNKNLATNYKEKIIEIKIDGCFMYAHAYIYIHIYTNIYAYIYVYLCIGQTKVKNIDIFFLLIQF